MYIDDFLTLEEYKSRRAKYQLQLDSLEKECTELDLSKYNDILNDDFINIYNTFSREEKRTFWRNTIDKVEINSNQEMELSF